eukprot:365813-Chlamydomonas_euryale.AAC.7
MPDYACSCLQDPPWIHKPIQKEGGLVLSNYSRQPEEDGRKRSQRSLPKCLRSNMCGVRSNTVDISSWLSKPSPNGFRKKKHPNFSPP